MKKDVLIDYYMGLLPEGISREMMKMSVSYPDVPASVSEVRLRAGAISSLTVGNRNIPLISRVSKEQIERTLRKMCSADTHLYRDSVERGFIPLDYGIRVGVTGNGFYAHGTSVGVVGVSSLCIRIPVGECDYARELCREYAERGGGNMLLVSPPACGKTTALRYIALALGSGTNPKRVVVVDERCEFIPSDYENATVDILRGYKRSSGIEIAIRTMNAQVVIADEIGSMEDAEAVMSAYGAGVDVIASVHGTEGQELRHRKYLTSLLDTGFFKRRVYLSRDKGHFGYSFANEGKELCISAQ